MSFRVRTAIVVLMLTALTMGTAFAVVWNRFVSAQQRQLDDALIVVAQREASEAAAGQLEFGDAPGPSANAVGPLPKYGVLYGVNGLPITSTSNFLTIPPMPRLVPFDKGFDFDHDGIPMRGVVVGVGNVESSGRRILLASPRLDFEEDKQILARAMEIAFGVGCIWAAIVAFGVATRLTREHAAVAAVARRVASGDTSARVELASTSADLGQFKNDLNAMIERLVGLLAVQERFISHAAHELRTPLASLRIELEYALRSSRTRDDYEVSVRGSLESVERLTNLAEDLLQLARAREALALHSDKTRTTMLEDALADAVADVAPLGRARDIFILTEPLSAEVTGDRRAIARVFRNVLENAVRFSPAGGRVRIDSRLDGERVLITVNDDGPGVGEGDGERIFEPFVRGMRNDDVDGTGLGLAIARGLARSVEGDVRAEVAGGGRFFIELPCAKRAARGGGAQASAEKS